ncbi:hypothetical protein [Sphingopyxis sp.]|uniref:hypothetical protein n=1 Tax=Sphingopyxis sp. TaxID=1908224 RepID=UPI00344BC65F
MIEVGVDVPAASLMIVEHADRFGLAQLHQLRGASARRGEIGACSLRSQNLSETARDRLALMRETNDGFVIAEKDLELRGGGELLGLRSRATPIMGWRVPNSRAISYRSRTTMRGCLSNATGAWTALAARRCGTACIRSNAMRRCRCSEVVS